MKTATAVAKTSNGAAPGRKTPAASLRELANDGSGGQACSREQMIAERAYFRAEQRGFAPGNEMSDWLQAEADIEHVLGGGQ